VDNMLHTVKNQGFNAFSSDDLICVYRTSTFPAAAGTHLPTLEGWKAE